MSTSIEFLSTPRHTLHVLDADWSAKGISADMPDQAAVVGRNGSLREKISLYMTKAFPHAKSA